jgi:hypothetical protein
MTEEEIKKWIAKISAMSPKELADFIRRQDTVLNLALKESRKRNQK